MEGKKDEDRLDECAWHHPWTGGVSRGRAGGLAWEGGVGLSVLSATAPAGVPPIRLGR